MSDAPQGPGWWQASDYKWYPPQPPAPPAPPIPEGMPAPQGPPAYVDIPAPQGPPAYQAPPAYTAPPAGLPPGGQQWAQPAPVYQSDVQVTVKKKSKAPLILGIVAAVLILGIGGCVAVVALAANEVDKELNENEARTVPTTAAPAPTEPGQPAPEGVEQPAPTEAPPAEGGPAGTREAPLAIGTEVDLGNGWRVTVNSADVTPGATAAIDAANEFNAPADDSMRYILVNMSATFAGTAEASTEAPFLGVSSSVFGSENVERNSYDAYAVAPEPSFDGISELAAGGKATGNVVFMVGANETNLVMRFEPTLSFDATETWIALG